MPIENTELLCYLNDLLKPEKFRDYAPNGLQVEGKKEIRKIITGVTASQALIDRAISEGADAILVHHGYFWKGENPCIQGMKKRRLMALLEKDINMFAYHLPLDAHPTLGNNAQLAERLGIEVEGGLDSDTPQAIAMRGRFLTPTTLGQLASKVADELHRIPMVEGRADMVVETVGWCTGGGQGYIELAADAGLDVFITGEASEQTIHTSRECNIGFVAAGHHATERYGAKALGDHIAEEFGIDVVFVDIDNPV